MLPCFPESLLLAREEMLLCFHNTMGTAEMISQRRGFRFSLRLQQNIQSGLVFVLRHFL